MSLKNRTLAKRIGHQSLLINSQFSSGFFDFFHSSCNRPQCRNRVLLRSEQRQPVPIGAGSDPVGDQNVGVELGVTRPRSAMDKGGSDVAVGVRLHRSGPPAAGERGVFLEELQRGIDSCVMGAADGQGRLVAGQRPQDRYRFWG